MDKQNNITYREWAPNAAEAFLIGEFSISLSLPVADFFRWVQTDDLPDDWSRESHPMKKDPFGVFEVVVPARDGQPAIKHNAKIKVSFSTLILPGRLANSKDLHDHTLGTTNRTHTSMD